MGNSLVCNVDLASFFYFILVLVCDNLATGFDPTHLHTGLICITGFNEAVAAVIREADCHVPADWMDAAAEEILERNPAEWKRQ